MNRFAVAVFLSSLAPRLARAEELAPSKPYELEPGGYIQLDARRTLTDQEAHDISVRTLRFRLEGGTPHFKLRALVDVAGSKLVVDDAWGELFVRPEFQLRAGKDKAPFGLERMQRDTRLVFIERAFPTQLSPNRDIGVWARGDVARIVHYAVGIVDGVADNAIIESETDRSVEYNAHVLVSPFATTKGLGNLAFGGGTTFGHTEGTLASPGITAPRTAGQVAIVKLATGMDAASTALADGYRKRFTGHGYHYGGPIGVLVEYVREQVPVALMGTHTTLTHDAWQAAVSVAVTPGDRPSYTGLVPARPFDLTRQQYGAVELEARLSQLRFDDDSFTSGIFSVSASAQRATEFATGVSWYFNDHVKLQVDYSRTSFTAPEGGTERSTENLIATRLQASI